MILTCYTCDRQVVAAVTSLHALLVVAMQFGWSTFGAKRAFCPYCADAMTLTRMTGRAA